jgi:glucose/arabinose dehydrogenase
MGFGVRVDRRPGGNIASPTTETGYLWPMTGLRSSSRNSGRAISSLAVLTALVAACGDSGTTPTPTVPAPFVLAPVDSGYDFSIYLTAPPGDPSRVLILERGGRIVLRKNGVRQDSAFLNLTSLTSSATGEYGIYSLAFHPQYATNHRLFVYYAALDGSAKLAEFAGEPGGDHATLTSQRVVLSQPESTTAVLYGGTIAFGRDGYLYLGMGDGQVGGDPLSHSQDSTSLLGKMLRIDVDHATPYAIPLDNPYVTRPGWRGEIWQLGLRNPWRWSFDRQTGDLYIGDVGEEHWEEIDYLPAPVVGGNNFGWPTTEGFACYQPAAGCFTLGLVPPLLQYAHGRSCAVVGGYAYRGAAAPALQGTYFYGDFCGGWIRTFRLVNDYPSEELPEVELPRVNGAIDNVVSFGEDANGELYVVTAAGRIYRIAPAS